MEKIHIGIYSDEGANSTKLARTLKNWGFAVSPLKQRDLTAKVLRDFDLLYLPGGWYQFDDSANEAIISYVAQGGGCIGSCAGSYLVAGRIPLIPGRVLRSTFRGRLYLEPQQGDHPILKGVVHPCARHHERQWEQIAVTHLGGPFIFPDNPAHIVASYDTEGEIGAIVAASVGKGRAVAIASHPELAVAALPVSDSSNLRRTHKLSLLPQGNAKLIVRNAVLWATGDNRN